MSDVKKSTALAPTARATKNPVEKIMAGLDEVAAAEASVAWISTENRSQAYHTDFVRWADMLLARDADEVAAKAAFLRKAAFGRTDARMLRILLAMCLDAIPAAKGLNGAAFLDAAVETIRAEPGTVTEKFEGYGPITRERGGFTNAVIARAVRRIWRTATFAPSIAEFLEALHAERREIQNTVGLAEQWLKDRAHLDTPAMQDRIRDEREREAVARERWEREAEEERKAQRDLMAEIEQRAAERRAREEGALAPGDGDGD
jgi:hypothetical protein